MARVWRCRRQKNGVICGQLNPRTRPRCSQCLSPRPKARKPAHAIALDMPYEFWVEAYGEVCGICGRTAKEGGRRLHRDHDHRTGKPRGLLCFRDNAALRTYMDLDWLRAAAAYLERSA